MNIISLQYSNTAFEYRNCIEIPKYPDLVKNEFNPEKVPLQQPPYSRMPKNHETRSKC